MNFSVIFASGLDAQFGDEIPKKFTKIHNKKILTFSVIIIL